MIRYNGIELTVGARLPGLLPSTWWHEKESKDDSSLRVKPIQVKAYVDYIHPLERYVIVRFVLPTSSFRETFPVLKGVMIA